MNRYIIDNNCLISYVTDRNRKQQKDIAQYFESAYHYDSELIIIGNVITEFVYVLTNIYNIEDNQVKNMIADLLKTPGIKHEMGYPSDRVLTLWPEKITNYGDAVVAAYGQESKLEILTFDARFSKELTRVKIQNKIPR